MEKTVLKVKSLRKRFDKKDKEILKGISFQISEGESVALIGSNGSGKSTLLRSCMRLIKPDEGTIELLGEDITHTRGKQLRKKRSEVGFVFQYHNLIPRLSVLTNVVHGALYRLGAPRGWSQILAPMEVREDAMKCLELVGLAQLANKRADALSGGQMQRVAIARALMQRPKLIFADEPVASLDPVAAMEVMDLFSNLMKHEGISLLFTSHSLEQAIKYSDRILGLKAGELTLKKRSSETEIQQLKSIYE